MAVHPVLGTSHAGEVRGSIVPGLYCDVGLALCSQQPVEASLRLIASVAQCRLRNESLRSAARMEQVTSAQP